MKLMSTVLVANVRKCDHDQHQNNKNKGGKTSVCMMNAAFEVTPLIDCLWVKGQCRHFKGTQDKKQPESEVKVESLYVSVVTQPPPQSCYPFTFASCSSGSANDSHLLTFFFSFILQVVERELVSRNDKTKSSQDSKMPHSWGTKSFFFPLNVASGTLQTSGICPQGSERKFHLRIFSEGWTDVHCYSPR